jgi:hypothetical protein
MAVLLNATRFSDAVTLIYLKYKTALLLQVVAEIATLDSENNYPEALALRSFGS